MSILCYLHMQITQTHVYKYIYVWICVYMCACVYVYTPVCMCAHLYMYVCKCVHMCIYALMCIHMCLYTCIQQKQILHSRCSGPPLSQALPMPHYILTTPYKVGTVPAPSLYGCTQGQ